MRRLNPFSSTNDVLLDWSRIREPHQFKNINVFIGANGGGKSTVLDLINAIPNPQGYATLPRENKKSEALTAFELQFSNGFNLFGMSVSNPLEGALNDSNVRCAPEDALDSQYLGLRVGTDKEESVVFNKNISKLAISPESEVEIRTSLKKLCCEVFSWDSEAKQDVAKLVAKLNVAAPHLHGVLSEEANLQAASDRAAGFIDGAIAYKIKHPFSVLEDGRIAIYLSDDSRQVNNIHFSTLPSGWKRLASILCWLEDCQDGGVCLIEEPETHMHPRLQRYLAREMAQLAKDKSLQLFVATHSPVFQQSGAWHSDVSVFEAGTENLRRLDSAWKVLDSLGIRGADISQSNGVIWVEGPSDRLYIKHWLSLWCKTRQRTEPTENVDYSFAFYGGSSLSHFTAQEAEGFIDMLKINRNFGIVMDRDLDLVTDESSHIVCTTPNSAKAKIMGAVNGMGARNSFVWVTDEYTMESYLPAKFSEKYFNNLNNRFNLKSGTKVHVAANYMKTHSSWNNCAKSLEPLETHIARLHHTITMWSK
ncbi:MAG: protein putative AbiEii toxin, Type system [Rhodocyclales bacterium]|nr:protein putative AbiEii toxin, Type system [Rhodocyclales bacterium]